jgi:putative nucleotidyltransferase with HDIG domain
LFDNADGALYWAKYQGKHQVFGFSDVVSQALQAESRIRAVHEHSRLDIVRALAAATDARDAATAYHSRQVAALSAVLGEQLGLDRDRINEIQTAALLHDVGKVAVPDSVLRKRSRLSPGERALLREHSELGARILDATELSYMAPWVRAHHERWDGAGYPDGLSGEEIPLEARIIGACNLYDQIVSGSPERGPLSREAALQEIDQGIGRALDPRVGEALIDVLERSRSLGWSEAWLS